MDTQNNTDTHQSTSARRFTAYIFFISIAFVTLIAAILFASRSSNERKPHRAIRIAQAGDFFLYAPLYIASDAGLFHANGLNVTITTTGGDEKTWAAVISGDASFGIADPTFVAVSGARGQPGKVIASIVNGVPFWGLSMNPNVPKIGDSKDLAPYRVATFPSPSTAYTLQKKMFLDAGLNPNIREGAFGTLLAMLASNQADIALELEPNVSQAVRNGAKVVYSLAELYGDFAITGLTVRPELLADDPGLAQNVVSALQAAVDFARSKPEETLNLLSRRFPDIKRDVAKDALTRILAAKIIPENVTVSPTSWNKAIDLRRSAGDVPNPKPMAEYVDNTFAERAANRARAK